jgi:CAAX protease family protein
VALTAGITEEVMFRGFVFWYFGTWAGPVIATLASSILFGFGHLYLGLAQAPKTAIGGLVACLVVLASGSLWPAIVMHAAVDLENGELGYRLFGRAPGATGPVSG